MTYGNNRRQRAALADRYQADGMSVSSPQKLLLAVFDRLEKDLADSVGAIEGGDVERSHRSLLHAQDLVHELNLALEPEVWPAAAELRQVYEHLLDLLIDANLTKSIDVVRRCQAIVRPLAETWHEAHRNLQQERLAEVVR
ncbi:MAG: flagellar export chaperone FliS [Actinomycetota bacterium]